jgi:hypothetical protein
MSSDSELWAAIYGLYRLMADKENREDKYQLFLERNQVAFRILGCTEARSYENRSGRELPFDREKGFQPQPDFLGIDDNTGTLYVIELKTPFVGSITTARSDGNRIKFKADAESYLSQTLEYAESIRGREAAREAVTSEFAIERISSYRICLIYALASENNPSHVARLSANRTIPCEIVFFDEFLGRMVSAYSLSRKGTEERLGMCFVFHVQITKRQTHNCAYLASYGNGLNSISVFIEEDFIIFQCIDAEGQCHHLSSKVEFDCPVYVRFEFSNDLDGIYMSLNVNNEERDLRIGSRVLVFNPNVFSFILGAGPGGENGAEFLMMEHYVATQTMTVFDKLGSFHYFERKLDAENKGIYFLPKDYMIRNAEGNMVQENAQLRPRVRVLPNLSA